MKMNSILSVFFLVCLFVVSQQQTTADVANLQNLLQQLNNTVNQIKVIAASPMLNYTVGGVNYYNYMYKDSIVYQDIFAAYQNGVFSKMGSPVGWNENSYSSALWNKRLILNIGTGVQNNANGITVTVPSGYNVLWLRVLNDRWATFRVVASNSADTTQAIYACGNRGISEVSPDGGEPDSYQLIHYWCPIPLYYAGNYKVYSDANSDDWISGIGFGKNLWNHAKNSAVAYYWALNGDNGVTWNSANWNSDSLAQITLGKINTLYVPVVNSGKNKILYFVEHNNNWVGIMHGTVTVNDQAVERFRATYSNPFARHIRGKIYNRYIATWFPASLLKTPTDKFVKVTIDMTKSDMHIYFREFGTHDYI